MRQCKQGVFGKRVLDQRNIRYSGITKRQYKQLQKGMVLSETEYNPQWRVVSKGLYGHTCFCEDTVHFDSVLHYLLLQERVNYLKAPFT
jgi:hypothetical protein